MCVVLFGSNSLKMSVLLYTNFDKKMSCVVWTVLFDMNSDKKYVGLFSIDTLKVSELFHMSSKIMQLLLFSKF